MNQAEPRCGAVNPQTQTVLFSFRRWCNRKEQARGDVDKAVDPEPDEQSGRKPEAELVVRDGALLSEKV